MSIPPISTYWMKGGKFENKTFHGFTRSRPSQTCLIVEAIKHVYFNGGFPAAVVAVVEVV